LFFVDDVQRIKALPMREIFVEDADGSASSLCTQRENEKSIMKSKAPEMGLFALVDRRSFHLLTIFSNRA